MNYITIKRTRINSISGSINLPYGTEVESMDGILFANGKPLCSDRSQNAYDYFARNDDGNGFERGKLTREIIKTLSKRDKDHQTRWDKVWEDSFCVKFKRKEHSDQWVWNHEFYNAEIVELQYIATLVGGSII